MGEEGSLSPQALNFDFRAFSDEHGVCRGVGPLFQPHVLWWFVRRTNICDMEQQEKGSIIDEKSFRESWRWVTGKIVHSGD
jgi:hypothetical protein